MAETKIYMGIKKYSDKTICTINQLKVIKGFMGKKKFKKFKKNYQPKTQLVFTQANKLIRCFLNDIPYSIIRLSEENSVPNLAQNLVKKNRQISQYDKAGNFIKTYNSIAQARQELNLGSGDINNVLSGSRNKTAGGYQWCRIGQENKIKNLLVPVKQYDKTGKFINQYESIKEASTALNTYPDSIKKVCDKELKSTAGFQFCYADQSLTNIIVSNRGKAVSQFTLSGEFIKTYISVSAATRELNLPSTSISNINEACSHYIRKKPNGRTQILKSACGYQWCFKGEENSIKKYINKTGGGFKKPVSQFTKEGKFIKTFGYIKEAERELNTIGVSSVCRGKTKTAAGYRWQLGDSREMKLINI